ncbi:MAG: uroporphyrinogen decarboxylase family protein [Pelobacteraceae bacterium]
MNSMERMQATMAGKPLDRRAVAPVLGLYGARLINCPLERYYSDPFAYARGQAAVREMFQPDVLYAPLAFASIGAAFGGELVHLDTMPPDLRTPAIQSIQQWNTLVPPDPDKHPQLLYFRDTIRLLAAQYGGEVPIVIMIPIPTEIPDMVMGLEGWLETVLFNPTAAQRVMEKIIPFYVRMVNGFFAAGASFVVMPCGFASSAIATRKMVSLFTRPILVNVLAQLNGPVVLQSMGAPMLDHLDLLTDMPQVSAFMVDQTDDLAMARSVIGPDSVLFGGLDCTNIGRMTATQVEERCRAILEERRQDARFVLGTSGPDVAWHTPPENIRALRKAADSFGRVAV